MEILRILMRDPKDTSQANTSEDANAESTFVAGPDANAESTPVADPDAKAESIMLAVFQTKPASKDEFLKTR